ncbi:hypothetical protein ACV35H_33815, partial [Pseudomonas aeruginosa]
LRAPYPLASSATLWLNVKNHFDRRYYDRPYTYAWAPTGEPGNLPRLLTLNDQALHRRQEALPCKDAPHCWKPYANWNARFA